MDSWRNNRLLYNIIAVISIINIFNNVISIILYSIPSNWLYIFIKNVRNISVRKENIILSFLVFLNIISIHKVEYLLGYLVINFILFRRVFYISMFLTTFGYLSAYNIQHMINLFCIINLYDVLKINIKKRIELYV